MRPAHDDVAETLQRGLPARYRLGRELGRGGMARVYLAQELHPRRQVAIKVLDPVITVGIGRQRFLREIDFVSNLTHPHIVPIYAAGEAQGLLYFVMPYIEGESLADRIRRDHRLPVPVALRFAADVARALECAHRHKIVHRDIKPENILLHEDFALVADFGVARAFKAARDEAVTQDGVTLGTPAYMSPEQVAGEPDIDQRADIYALGCVLYHMVAGEPPFGQGPWDQVLKAQLHTTPEPLASRAPGTPPGLSALVTQTLAKRAQDRPATAGELARGLDDLRAGFTSGERAAVPRASRGRPWLRALVAAGSVAAVAAIAVLAGPGRSRVAPLTAAAPVYAESVAVMPIENLTVDPALTQFADAVTYEVIASLHRIPDLKIPAYASVRRLAGAPVTPAEVVTRLRVGLVLTSQLRQVSGQLRLDAELVDGGSNRLLRGGSWTVGPTAAGGVEAGLVRRLVELVAEGTGLTMNVEQAAGLEGPAYQAYRLGQYWLSRRTPHGVRRAISAFRDALAQDSAYAPAYEGLSTSYMLGLFYRYEIGIDGYEAAAQALSAAERAVAIDPLYAPGYAARGYVVSRAYGPMDRAAEDFRRALELAPNAGQAVAWSGAVYAWQGDSVRALQAALRGAELDPLSPATQLSLALAVLPAGQYDRAAAAARHATELEPELMESRAVEGRALALAGRLDECLRIAFGPHAAIRAICLHSAGRHDEAETIADSIAWAVEAGALGDTAYTAVARADGLASYYAWTGRYDLAMRWLAFAFAHSPLGVDRRVLESRGFDSLWADPVGGPRLAELIAGVWAKVTAAARRH